VFEPYDLDGDFVMNTALDVARYLLHLSNQEPEPELVTHLRLQKLLYYCQGWALTFRDEPLFPDRIEAWLHGPVVTTVYPIFADYASAPLAPHEGRDCDAIDRNTKSFLQSIWDEYKKHSASELRRKTHEETPWKAARGQRGPDDPAPVEITHSSLTHFFPRNMSARRCRGLI